MDHSERLAFLSVLVEVFEDFLEKRGIVLDNPEKEQDPDVSNVYGSDYFELESGLENALITAGMLEKEEF